MTLNFHMIEPGWYEADAGKGLKAIAKKVTSGWYGYLSGPMGAKTLENGQHFLEAATLRAVKSSLTMAAA